MATPALPTIRNDFTVFPIRIEAKKSVVSWPRPDSFDAFGRRVAKRRPMAGRPGPSLSRRSLVAITKSSTADVLLPVNDSTPESGAGVRWVIVSWR